MENQYPPPPPPAPSWGRPAEPTVWQKVKKLLAPIGIVVVLFVKFFAKLKFIILPVLKFLPAILKTGGTMIITICTGAFGAADLFPFPAEER